MITWTLCTRMKVGSFPINRKYIGPLVTHSPFLAEKLLTLQEEPLFFFEIAEKESSGCFCLPVVSFSSLLIVKNRKPDLTWLKEKGNLLAHMIKKEWRDTRAQPMSSRPVLSPSLISGFVCQTSLLGSRWWHLEELEKLPSTNPKGNSRVFPLSPRKVLKFPVIQLA